MDDSLRPHGVIELISSLIDQHFPKGKFHETYVPKTDKYDIIPPKGLRVRLAAALVATAYACEIINRDTTWVRQNPSKRYVSTEWSFRAEKPRTRIHEPKTKNRLIVLLQKNLSGGHTWLNFRVAARS